MTFDEYINNPMGEKNAVMSNRTMYRNLYKSKLDKVLVREAGKIDYKLYKGSSKYYCYIKIPSEVVKDVYYDVIIEFRKPKDKSKILDTTLKEYEVRFYSNDPSFMFTFCHAFVKHDMFIKAYADKMSKKAIKEKANEKNPQDIVGYVKSFYFAYLIMQSKGLFNKIRYVEAYSESNIKKDIMDADSKLEQRQEAAKAKASKKRASTNRLQDEIKHSSIEKSVTTKVSNKIKTTPTTGSIKKTSTIKKTKSTRKKG